MNNDINSFTFTRSELSDTYNRNNSSIDKTKNTPDNKVSDVSELILKAFTQRAPEIAVFILSNMTVKFSNITKLDIYGRNILHYLIIFYGYDSIRNLFNDIMNNSKDYPLKDMINVQDKLGNSPLHYAVMFQLYDIANIIIKNGGKKELKNNEGDYIKTDTDTSTSTATAIVPTTIVPTAIMQTNKQNTVENTTRNNTTKSETIHPTQLIILQTKPTHTTQPIKSTLHNKDNTDMTDMTDMTDITDLFIKDTPTGTDRNRNMMSDIEINSALEKIVQGFSQPSQQSQQSRQSRQSRQSQPSETFKLPNSVSISALKNITQDTEEHNGEHGEGTRTEDVANNLLSKLKKLDIKSRRTNIDDDDTIITPVELAVLPRTGEPPSRYMEPTTEMMIENLRGSKKPEPQLLGGVRKQSKTSTKTKSKGSRRVLTFSELSYGEPIKSEARTPEINKKKNVKDIEIDETEESVDTDTDNKLTSELSEMARNIARQSNDIHERSIEKIAEILKLDLKNPEENKKVRNYKAAIWKMVKDKHPELSNYDRSVEMEKNITKDVLKSINIDQVSKEIEQYFSEKSKSEKSETSETSKEDKKEKKDKKKVDKDEKKEKKGKESKPVTKKSKKVESEDSNKTLSISTESEESD
jgi:hypothetical protein